MFIVYLPSKSYCKSGGRVTLLLIVCPQAEIQVCKGLVTGFPLSERCCLTVYTCEVPTNWRFHLIDKSQGC